MECPYCKGEVKNGKCIKCMAQVTYAEAKETEPQVMTTKKFIKKAKEI